MGRTERSQGLAPPGIRKDARAKQARHIVQKVIPAILASNARARRGAEGSELIADPVATGSADSVAREKSSGGIGDGASKQETIYVTRKGQGRRKMKNLSVGMDEDLSVGGQSGTRGKRKGKELIQDDRGAGERGPEGVSSPKRNRTIRIISSDTLTVAYMLAFPTRYPHHRRSLSGTSKPHGKPQNVCILNMASPLRPGGGVLSGATSQEEFLCARTTLLSSLKENFYRLPELGGIWTSDVLVFRSALSLGDSQGELGPGDRYWLDVISAGMLRFPELEGEEDEEKKLGKKDRELVGAKMRAVLRIAASKGVRKLVLGAWGCGAYGNPVADVAKQWNNMLCGNPHASTKGRKGTAHDAETWDGVEEVVFAVSNSKMAHDFAQAFGGGIEVESGPENADGLDRDEEEDDSVAEELRSKIKEMQGQVDEVWNPELKARMLVILEGLRAQLQEREGGAGAGDDDESGRNQQAENSEARHDVVSDQRVDRRSRGTRDDIYDDDDEMQDLDGQGGVRIDE